MALVLIFLTGILFGIFVAAFVYKRCRVGVLRIDHSDPNDVPYMFLELSKGLDDVASKRNVILKVDTKSLGPQK